MRLDSHTIKSVLPIHCLCQLCNTVHFVLLQGASIGNDPDSASEP